jgi:hypothetical protein
VNDEMEVTGLSPIEMLSQLLPRGTGKNYKKPRFFSPDLNCLLETTFPVDMGMSSQVTSYNTKARIVWSEQ